MGLVWKRSTRREPLIAHAAGSYAAMFTLVLALGADGLNFALVMWVFAPLSFPWLSFAMAAKGFGGFLTPEGLLFMLVIYLGTATWVWWWLSRRAIRRVRKQAGFCVFCGYDLRASGERYPECGRPK